MERRAISNLSSSFRAKVSGLRKRFPYFIILHSSFIIFLLLSQVVRAQITPPQIEWQRNFGGPKVDEGFSIVQTADGGYTIGAYTNGASDNYIPGYHGYEDAWVINVNASGQMQWQKCLGGSLDEEINSIVQTADGGYCCAIRTESDDGDVLNSNDGPSDAWIVKINSTGDIEWQNDMGGSNFNDPLSIVECAGGGFVFAGYTVSTDGDVTGHHGTTQNADAWVVKLSSSGKMLWGKCFGGSGIDWAQSIVQTRDGGFCFAGYTNSLDGDVTGFHGGTADFWVVKLDDTGMIQWQKCFGGDSDEFATSIAMDSDGGFAVTGYTYSNDGDVSGNHGGKDLWVVKMDSAGDLQWQKCLGGSGDDLARSVAYTNDGGFIVAGSSGSNDGDVSGNHGGVSDAWVVKLGRSGEMQWQKCMGGTNTDKAFQIIQTADDQYIFAGSTLSHDGDITRYFGSQDVWVVKLDAPKSIIDDPITPPQNGLSLTAQLNSNSATLSFVIPTAPSDVRIDVTNILGVRVEQIEEKATQTGYQTFPIDLTHFIAGSYFVTVSAGGMMETTKISKE